MYPDGQYCMWRIMVKVSFQVALMFKRFSLQSENNTDAVYVYDGNDQTGKVLGVFYGSQPPPRNGIYSSSNSLLVIFRSDKNGSFYGFQASYSAVQCSGALGMESGAISDAQITASSRMNNNSTPRQARLNFIEQGIKQGGWSSHKNDRNQWLQVDLGSHTTVTGVATQGRNSTKWRQWIATFTLQFSFDGVIFQSYKEPGKMSAKVLHANQDSDTVVYNKLISPITARYIRLLPVTWYNHISLRMELYGCGGCSSPLGMESQVISDAQITASTEWNNYNSAKFARLNLGGWVARAVDSRQWLQVDLGTYSSITSVATQGVNLQGWRKCWTASYNLKIVLVGVQGEGSRYASSAVSALKRLGASDPVLGSFRSSFAFAGYAGTRQPSWMSKQKIQQWKARYNGPSQITLKIPLSSRDYKCQNQTLQGQKGVIHSPNYPEIYPDGQYCMWRIMVKASFQVALMFTRFSLQSENNTDAVYVYDGNDQTGKVLGVFYGGQPPPKNGIYSSSNSLLVIFRSDKNGSFYGFQASYSAVKCSGALGMESGAISDAQITASSRMNNNSTPRQARLNFIEQGIKQGGWSSLKNDRNQWLQVDLGSHTTVTGVATQGRNSTKWRQWIATFTLQFSFDGVIFQSYKEPGKMSAKVLHANQDSDAVVYNKLISPITARYIRLLPVTWYNHISLRMELYGCRGCSSPLGMESQVISDAQITASTEWNNYNSAKFARLNLGGWVARAVDPRQWLQVDLGTYSSVTRVATQGVNLRGRRKCWTTSYKLQYSDDGITFHFYKEPGGTLPKVLSGNQNFHSVVSNKLRQPITARYIRFKPLLWNYRIGMRTEIHGCLGVCNDDRVI
ncbi:uncharacterized protein LOC113665691 [Pocillopora damicornis]|uniref:uncharacterized protein LOC113665691 n=1 Tax=Pocillopora damicornis TaxID=46731 RepID=UPI000F54FB06|nr:uncharacterized protein LOC113665691 [Pocillopora damicornis]